MEQPARPPATPLPPEVKAQTAVVIAAFNEGRAIGDVVRGVRAEFPNVIADAKLPDGSPRTESVRPSDEQHA